MSKDQDGVDWAGPIDVSLAVVEDHIFWNGAVAAAEMKDGQPGDTSALVAILRSDAEITRYGRRLLADVLERYTLTRRGLRGRPRLPINRVSLAEARLLMASKMVKHEHPDKSVGDALIAVFEAYKHDPAGYWELKGISIDKLENYMLGRRGSSRRSAHKAKG